MIPRLSHVSEGQVVSVAERQIQLPVHLCGWSRGRYLVPMLLVSFACNAVQPDARGSSLEWRYYAGDPGGSRYSEASLITRRNVEKVEIAWRTPIDTGRCLSCNANVWRFEATPLMWHGLLYLPSPYGHVLAMDAQDGRTIWRFDPAVDVTRWYSEGLTARGIAVWEDSVGTLGTRCKRRLFHVTVDGRLFALDATEGIPCEAFGKSGVVQLRAGMALNGGDPSTEIYSVTSPPAVIGSLVVVGSAVNTGRDRQAASGAVRAFDARTGSLQWSFDPVPRSDSHPARSWWRDSSAHSTGGANAWAPISIDAGHDPRFSADCQRGTQLLRRPEAGQQRLRELSRGASCVDWPVRVVLSDRPPRSLGLRRCGTATCG